MWRSPNAPDALARGLTLPAAVATVLHLGFETRVQPPTSALIGAAGPVASG